jgi:Tol biopolymer transport system component
MAGQGAGRRGGIDRRELLGLGGAALLAAQSGPLASAGPRVGLARHDMEIRQGTNIAFALSRDGKQIAFDLGGMLWIMPASGGKARALTSADADLAHPDWSPDGRTIIFQSYQDGGWHLWEIGADGKGQKRLVAGPYDCREPRFSPDGSRIAFASDRDGAYGIYILDRATGAVSLWAQGGGDLYEPSWSPDGKTIAYIVDRRRIETCTDKGARETIVDLKQPDGPRGPGLPQSALAAPAFHPDGADIWYVQTDNGVSQLRTSAGRIIVEGEDVFPFRPHFRDGSFIYASDGLLRRRLLNDGQRTDIPFSATLTALTPSYGKKTQDYDQRASKPVVGIGSPLLSPDGKRIVFRALNQIWLLDIATGKPAALTQDGYHKSDPSWSPDGAQIAYACDRGGTIDIWLHDLRSDASRQLTRFEGAAASCAWSPDGKSIALLSEGGGLHLATVATGATRRLIGDLYQPGRPSWSPDGKTIALAALKPYSRRFREGLNEILTVDVASGSVAYQPISQHRSIATRGDDGPVWAPDGRHLAFIFASQLHVAPIDAKGKLTGAPRKIADEVADAPSWSADGKALLFLSLGKLRLVPIEGGAARTIACHLSFARAKSPTRLIVQAERLWNGVDADIRRDVELVVEDGRIVALAPRGRTASDANAQRIDATGRTVIPGLVDMHAHHQMQGYGFGDRSGRLWLAMGVTSTRAPANPCYHMVEARESIQSGARFGPRCFGTGEGMDGARVYYNFMRPVTEPGQLDREFQRALALSYDLFKTYVRLPPALTRQVIQWSHLHGLHVTGHYDCPALAYGADAMEHMGATNRLGYSRTVSAAGKTYQDTQTLFEATGAARIPTLFQAMALLPDDPSFLADERVKALYPPWEYAKLEARARLMASIDRTSILDSLRLAVEEVARLHRAGGHVVTGTDSPIDFNVVSFHMNLRAMVRYGMTPHEALTTATRSAGEFLQAPIGTLQPGKLADMAIVRGSPLERIEDAAAVERTLVHGIEHRVEDLLTPFSKGRNAHAGHRHGEAWPPSPYWWHQRDAMQDDCHV